MTSSLREPLVKISDLFHLVFHFTFFYLIRSKISSNGTLKFDFFPYKTTISIKPNSFYTLDLIILSALDKEPRHQSHSSAFYYIKHSRFAFVFHFTVILGRSGVLKFFRFYIWSRRIVFIELFSLWTVKGWINLLRTNKPLKDVKLTYIWNTS